MSKLALCLLLSWAAVGLFGCSSNFPPTANGSDLPRQMTGRQVLVTLPERLKSQWSAISGDLGRRNGIEASGEFPLPSIGVDCLVYKVPQNQAVSQVIAQLRADRRVVLAQENQVFEGIQSGESDAFADISYGPRLIHADSAHRLATGKGVRIAVVDTGAEKEHPDLKGRLTQTANFVDGGDRSFTRDRHGTAVAGVIGARANDGIGIYGIAPDAELSVLKACWYPADGDAKAQCSSWSLAKALDAAIASGARIINLSLAGPRDELLEKLLQTAHERGISIVAATLEKQDQPGFPAELGFTIPVVSSGPDSQITAPTWLSRFPGVVAAPGIEVLSTVPKEGYDFLSGSSLATAHVSGVIALMLELQPDLKPDRIKELLVNPAGGAVDACAVLRALQQGAGC